MEKNKIKEALKKSYQTLHPFSEKYKIDFKRFLFSLDLFASGKLIRDKKILDIGSGIGIMAVALKNFGVQVTGIDKFIFPDETENCYTIADFDKLKYIWNENGIKFIKADVTKEKLPFNDDYFDFIICEATIEHLNSSPRDLFAEVYRILKKDGLFLITTPNFANLLKRLRFLLGRSPDWDIWDFFHSGPDFRGHRREFTLNELVKMLEWSSFEIIKKKTKNIFFNPRRLFMPGKIASQLCSIMSSPFSSMREMIYVLSRKK